MEIKTRKGAVVGMQGKTRGTSWGGSARAAGPHAVPLRLDVGAAAPAMLTAGVAAAVAHDARDVAPDLLHVLRHSLVPALCRFLTIVRLYVCRPGSLVTRK